MAKMAQLKSQLLLDWDDEQVLKIGSLFSETLSKGQNTILLLLTQFFFPDPISNKDFSLLMIQIVM